MAQRKDIANSDQQDGEKSSRARSRASSSAYGEPFSFTTFTNPFNGSFSGSPDKTVEKLMTQSKNQFEKMSQEANEISRESMDAFVKSGSIFMKGFEDILRTATAIAQSSAEKQAEFVKEALSTKTLNEWTEVQNKAAQSNFDDFMSGATQLSELSVKLMTEATEPLNAQASKAIKKASESMAA